jgi:virginiamycin A acetyltransferase
MENDAVKTMSCDKAESELKQRVKRLELRGRCCVGFLFHAMLRVRSTHPIVFRMLSILEGGTMFSRTIREALSLYYGVHVGMYSYGPCMQFGSLPIGTRIGNYCSIADGLRVFRRNHPLNRLSQHALFFNYQAGLITRDTIDNVEANPLIIGHDVWIGANVIIAPGCKIIGNGAVIGAGAVVAEDVPAFAIVGGVPAKLIHWRFNEDIQQCLEKSQWWLRPLCDIVYFLPLFEKTIDLEIAQKLENLRIEGGVMLPDISARLK